MAKTHFNVGVGVIAIQPFIPGENPTEDAETIYTCGEVKLTAGDDDVFIKGPAGKDDWHVPVGASPMLELSLTESPPLLEAYRSRGKVTLLAANTSAQVRYLASFQVAGGLKDEAALRAAVNALTPATNAPPGAYSIGVSGSNTPTLTKIHPVPRSISTDTTVFSAALASTTFVPASPPANSSGSVFALVSDAIDRGFEVDYTDRTTYNFRIYASGDFDLGNAFKWIEVGAAVPVETEIMLTRGGLDAYTQNFHILGDDIQYGQFNRVASVNATPALA